MSCRNAECFLQLLHLLNLDHSPEQGEDLCFEVLATLTALLCNNEASRSRLQDVVGYDTLFNIIVKLVDSHGPSEQLLMQLLGLVLEVTSCLRHAWQSPLKGLMYRPLICCCRTKAMHECYLPNKYINALSCRLQATNSTCVCTLNGWAALHMTLINRSRP